MQFEITKAFIEQLSEAIASGQDTYIREHLVELHPADIADIFEQISIAEARYVYQFLDDEQAADALLELEDDKREKFLAALSSKEIAEQVIKNIDSDDAADVLGELPERKQEEVISHLKDEAQVSELTDLLAYDEDSAGGLMAKELIKVNVNWTVSTCIREMRRQSEEVDNIYTIYVVDDNDTLLGRLSIKRLLFASSSTRTVIGDLYEPKVRYATEEMDAEEVAGIFEKYDLVVLPVVDGEHKLLGRITVDDIVDVIKEEAEKDYQMASGISENVESSDSIWVLSRARLPWLLIGMVGGMLGAKVIAEYEVELQTNATLAFFIPLIMAMGGNVGVQSSAIVVQGLANNSIQLDSMFKRLLKEFGVAIFNGTVLVSLIFAFIYFFFDSDYMLGLTVGISLYAVIIFAGLFGTFIPLILNRYKIDPALATGPFITTVNDVLGLAIYFIVGSLIYIGA